MQKRKNFQKLQSKIPKNSLKACITVHKFLVFRKQSEAVKKVTKLAKNSPSYMQINPQMPNFANKNNGLIRARTKPQ